MKIVSFTEARNSLKNVLNAVFNDADTTVMEAVHYGFSGSSILDFHT